MADPITDYSITAHATLEMQRHAARPGRDVLQSRVTMGGRKYLIRVFVDWDRKPAEVVTVYRTSKIGKYWRD